MGKHYLVTGGAGFIGSSFIDLILKEEKDVMITNVDCLTYAGTYLNMKTFAENSNYRFFRCSIADAVQLLSVFDCTYDAIINFAAETHVDRSIKNSKPFIETNIIGTHHLLEAVRLNKAKKMIQISTDEVYGSVKQSEITFTENSPLLPNNPYSASKASADLLCRSYMKTHQLPVIITRCTNNYGPRQHPEKLIPKVIVSALKSEPIPIFGGGRQIRDWLYVDDHCRAVLAVLKKGQNGEVYNISAESPLINIEVVKQIQAEMNFSNSLIKFVEDRKGHDFAYALSSQKIREQLGWHPQVSFEEGLKTTIASYMGETS